MDKPAMVDSPYLRGVAEIASYLRLGRNQVSTELQRGRIRGVLTGADAPDDKPTRREWVSRRDWLDEYMEGRSTRQHNGPEKRNGRLRAV